MSSEIIPIDYELAYQDMVVTLADVDYRLTLAYNTRDARWYLDVALSDGTDLVNGVPLVTDTPLLLRHSNEDLPAGILMLVDVTGEGAEGAKADLGNTRKLIFTPWADLS